MGIEPAFTEIARLYIAGDSAHSVIALENLHAALVLLARPFPKVEVVDLQAVPLRALKDKVFVTPTLRLVGAESDDSSPSSAMVGDLSDHSRLVAFLTAEQRILRGR